ncbi:hypothetical protein BD410DRAFT_595074 [Rickenella mellea]|uniref:FHA domain-containing protein n=1 Tax=Rickenella mellea TaxID=50990 RepID=A0A4Y7QCT1_9AGAM|nr:hypothetical protein BD410DRAFT_595074 [Rickenella mellea]
MLVDGDFLSRDVESHDYGHSLDLEWPGSDTSLHSKPQPQAERPSTRPQNCVRLLVASSSILSRSRKIAVLDAYPQIQVGRDRPNSEVTPHIRLKEMEVSKHHATLFWDLEVQEWAIVDMGSKHGTFIARGTSHLNNTSPDSPGGKFTRLSPSRVASVPHSLHHLDEVSIGTTVFIVHLHPDLPCLSCASTGENEICLFAIDDDRRDLKQVGKNEEQAVHGYVGSGSREDTRRAITSLKRALLAGHTSSPQSEESIPGNYIDRSAKRRALHAVSRGDKARMHSLASSSRSTPSPSIADAYSLMSHASPSVSMSLTATQPLPESNVGHRLLSNLGWSPGTALGQGDSLSSDDSDSKNEPSGLLEPLPLSAHNGRLGLGMQPRFQHQSTPTEHDWKVSAKRRRYDDIQRAFTGT